MSKPFDFYQNTGHGIFGVTSSKTGPVAPIDVIDFFTGYFIPPNVEAGKDKGFTWNNPGNRADFSFLLTGEIVQAPFDNTTVSCAWKGGLFPHFKESGTLYLAFSGASVKDNIDTVAYNFRQTGAFRGDSIDSVTFSSKITSGAQIKAPMDSGILSFQFSGSLSDVTADNFSLTCSWRGGFTSPYVDKDNTIAMALYDVLYSDDVRLFESVTSGASGDITFKFIKLAYSNY